MTAFSDTIGVCHIPKTAGHSVREYLAEHVEGVRDLADMYERPPHLALRDWEAWTGRHPSSFARIFAVIRDPYEHQLSQWRYWKDMYARGFRGSQFVHAALNQDLTHWLLDPMSDWHVYDPRPVNGIRRTVAPDGAGYQHFGGYYAYWLEVDGHVPDNVVLLRMDTLSRDLPRALGEALGRDLSGDVPVSNEGPPGADVRPYYTPTAIDIVASKFAWSFEHGLFGRLAS